MPMTLLIKENRKRVFIADHYPPTLSDGWVYSKGLNVFFSNPDAGQYLNLNTGTLVDSKHSPVIINNIAYNVEGEQHKNEALMVMTCLKTMKSSKYFVKANLDAGYRLCIY
jgi:hypothetical protein